MAGTEAEIIIRELLASGFFTESCCFTKKQIRAGENKKCLLCGMMLLDRKYTAGFRLDGFSGKNIKEYEQNIKDGISSISICNIRSAVEYLTDAFTQKNRHLNNINIPMLVYISDCAQDYAVSPLFFRQWFEYFMEKDIRLHDYQKHCLKGHERLESIDGRIKAMEESFAAYNGISIS